MSILLSILLFFTGDIWAPQVGSEAYKFTPTSRGINVIEYYRAPSGSLDERRRYSCTRTIWTSLYDCEAAGVTHFQFYPNVVLMARPYPSDTYPPNSTEYIRLYRVD